MIAPTSTAVPLRYGFQQAAAPQLRAAAERAQRDADFLQMQAREAWQKVASAETNARVADGRASDAVVSAARAQGNLVTFLSKAQGATATSAAVQPASSIEPQSVASVVSPVAVPPVVPATVPAVQPGVNNMGQRVGTLINVAV